jgi:hypothetical protein
VNARRAVAAAVLLLGAPLMTACGLNFDEQTDQVYNPAAGVDDRSGSVDVLNALIVSGTDGSGTIVASLVNKDQVNDDTLRGITGAGADADLKVTHSGATTIPAGGMLNLATQAQIDARGSRVNPGNFVKIKFTFDRGQAITVDAPVVSADDPTYKDIKVPG